MTLREFKQFVVNLPSNFDDYDVWFIDLTCPEGDKDIDVREHEPTVESGRKYLSIRDSKL